MSFRARGQLTVYPRFALSFSNKDVINHSKRANSLSFYYPPRHLRLVHQDSSLSFDIRSSIGASELEDRPKSWLLLWISRVDLKCLPLGLTFLSSPIARGLLLRLTRRLQARTYPKPFLCCAARNGTCRSVLASFLEVVCEYRHTDILL